MINIKAKEKMNLLQELAYNGRQFEQSMNSLHRKQTGSYYTALELTEVMMRELIDSLTNDERKILYTKRFLEPCVGSGNFVFAYLKVVSELGYSKEQYTELINNIYVCDINKKALDLYKEQLSMFAKTYFDIQLSESYFKTNIGGGLLFDVDSTNQSYIELSEIFDEGITNLGFDIIATNPPYKNLKAENVHYESVDKLEADKKKYETIKKVANKNFKYATTGTINIYKLFVEEIIEKYASKNGIISLLIPSSILSDKTCEKLRTRIIESCAIKSLKLIGEECNYVDAQQALCAMLLHKGKINNVISITKNFGRIPNEEIKVNIDDIINHKTGNSILALNYGEYAMYNQLKKFPVIKELGYIINMRGELDLTMHKSEITTIQEKFPLLRGRNIGYYELVETPEREFVSQEFVDKCAKKEYIFSNRIVCQQISNMSKKRRVTFAMVEPFTVLGNSCNFISVKENNDGIDIYFILGLLNSSLINWFFKLNSSNNHINNYEIDNFPIPVSYEHKEQISQLVQDYLISPNESILNEIERFVLAAYDISELQTKHCNSSDKNDLILEKFFCDFKHIFPNITLSDADNILSGKININEFILSNKQIMGPFENKVAQQIFKKYIKLKNNQILNHTTFKLSDLDMEMVRSVPQGGNWKSIPQEIINKSQRLVKITKTGGRTTLYGRIDYTKPSYTITTFFNRPGNGTNIHPIHDRVLSVREAARFQSFKDDYLFYGNQSQILKQVGNAVPTLLAYQIANNIVEKCDCRTSIDLFCGAGGMTAGFKEAGIHSILSNDIEESACITLKANNPEIEVFCGDITQQETKDYIVEKALEKNVDVICGGPPCQGFSLAGFRLIDDPRNQLFKEFVEIVSRIKPKVIVFENVDGILSFQGGVVYRSILDLFSELGYNTEGRVLMANDFGVPQKRKRVFIICTRKDINILPQNLFPEKVIKSIENQVSAFDTIHDLEGIECTEEAIYVNNKESDYAKMLKGEISYREFIDIIKTKVLMADDNTNFDFEQLVIDL